MSIYFYGCISLDGYFADQDHRLDWLHQFGSSEDTSYKSFYEKMDITIMGKKTFNAIENIENISSVYATTKNYVFTHTETLAIKSFIPINDDVIQFVEQIEKGKKYLDCGRKHNISSSFRS